MYKRFNQLAYFFSSLAAVMIGHLCLIGFMIFETQSLFEIILPGEMGVIKRLIASVLVAVVFEFSILISTANTNYLNRYVPYILAIASFFLIVWFWRAWEGDMITCFYKFFVSGLQAYLNLVYSDLLVKKYRESVLSEDKANLQRVVSELEQSFSELKKEHSEFEQSYIKKKKEAERLTCPKCGMLATSIQALNAHVSKCKGEIK